MTNLTPEYDKFKALEEVINDASLRIYGQPADPMVVIDLEALVLADWKKSTDKATPQCIMNDRTRIALKHKANSRQAARRQQWFNEVRRVE
jgi:hypothetical protein